MRVPKKLKALIGTEFDPDALYEAAAWQRIRLCEVFTTATTREEGKTHIKQQQLSHYFTGFSRRNFQARKWYTKSLLPQECREILETLQRAQARLEALLPAGEITEEKLAEEMARITGETMEDMEGLLGQLRQGMQDVMQKLKIKLDSNRVYPWDHVKYKIDRINLPDLPRHRYRGPVLRATVQDGIIQSMSLRRS